MPNVYTDGYNSAGGVTAYGSWDSWNKDYPFRVGFQWGYGSFGTNTPTADVWDSGGSYSRNIGAAGDRTIKIRARGYDYKLGIQYLGGSSGDFRTFAGAVGWSGLFPGTPTAFACPVTGSVTVNTVESTGSVGMQYRVVGSPTWTDAGTVATGLSGSGATGLGGTLAGLVPSTNYEARYRVDRTTVNDQVGYSPSGYFTTLSAAATVVSSFLINATGQMFKPAILPVPTLIAAPIIADALGEMLAPDIVIPTGVLSTLMTGTGQMFAPTLRLVSGSFEDFLLWPDRREIVLAEITPSITLRTWTQTPGFSNVWQIAVNRIFTAGAFAGGVYRRVVGVRENATDLTEKVSIISVQTTASSWFWDEAAGVLYVRSSTAASPDTFTAYQAFVTYFIATEGVAFERIDGDPTSAVYYHPWLSGDLPRISQYMEDQLLGIKITEGGTVGFTNTHGFFNFAIPDHNWKNKRVKLLFAGEYGHYRLQRSQYATLTTMLVDDLSANEESASMALKPMPRLLDLTLPITPLFETEYPNLDPGVRGTRKWLGWGRATVPPDLTDTSGLGVYTVADAAFQTLTAVHNVWAEDKKTKVRTLMAPGTHYTVDLTACTVTVVSGFPWNDNRIVVDVTGKSMSTFAGIVRDMLQTHLGTLDVELDLPSFSQAEADAPQELGVWLKEDRSIASILATTENVRASLERSVLGSLQYTPEGKWRVRIWSPGYDVTTVRSLRREDFAVFSPEPKLETVFSRSLVCYGLDHSTQAWAIQEAVDLAVEYLSETKEAINLFTFLREDSDALVLAQRAQLLAGSSPLEVEFKERGAKLTQELAGDIVLITYDPLPLAGGAAVNKPFEILRLDRGLSPTFEVGGRLGDLRGIVSSVGHWTDETAPRWDQATDEQKETMGFWTDANGLLPDQLGTPDPESENRSVWW